MSLVDSSVGSSSKDIFCMAVTVSVSISSFSTSNLSSVLTSMTSGKSKSSFGMAVPTVVSLPVIDGLFYQHDYIQTAGFDINSSK